MAEPDPATRPTPDGYLPELVRTVDRVAVAEVFLAGARGGADAFDAWYSQFLAPPLPPEPPNGTVLRGHDTDLWQRNDDPADIEANVEGDRWWATGKHYPLSWAEAYEKGADPSRRLVELPDPDNGQVMMAIADTIRAWDEDSFLTVEGVRLAVRAFTERGQA